MSNEHLLPIEQMLGYRTVEDMREEQALLLQFQEMPRPKGNLSDFEMFLEKWPRDDIHPKMQQFGEDFIFLHLGLEGYLRFKAMKLGKKIGDLIREYEEYRIKQQERKDGNAE